MKHMKLAVALATLVVFVGVPVMVGCGWLPSGPDILIQNNNNNTNDNTNNAGQPNPSPSPSPSAELTLEVSGWECSTGEPNVGDSNVELTSGCTAIGFLASQEAEWSLAFVPSSAARLSVSQNKLEASVSVVSPRTTGSGVITATAGGATKSFAVEIQ